jgi:hypothetical protein
MLILRFPVGKRQLRWGFITDHPIPVSNDKYYYEVEVLESGKDRPYPYVSTPPSFSLGILTTCEGSYALDFLAGL